MDIKELTKHTQDVIASQLQKGFSLQAETFLLCRR